MKSLLDSLRQAWLVLLLAVVFGIALAGVHVGLQERIEANRREEILRQIPALLLGAEVADSTVEVEAGTIRLTDRTGEVIELSIAESEVAGHQVFDVAGIGRDDRLGWVVRGDGPGYADTIDLLIGVGPDRRAVTGLYVVAQKETPGLGDAVTGQAFRSRFIGAPTDRPLRVTRDESRAAATEGRVLAITAATISSESVAEIVNQTLAAVLPALPSGTPEPVRGEG